MYTSKKDLLDDQKRNGIIPSTDKYMSTVRRIHRTSGTTGQPLYIAMNERDIDVITEIGARCFRNAGVTNGMKVVHCLNFRLWIGGMLDAQSLQRAGACLIPFGVGGTKELIETIMRLKIEAISCTPSYMSVIEKVLKEEFSMEPHQLGLKLGLFGGEGGLQNPEFRSAIESKWNIIAIDSNFGSADTVSMFASENFLSKDGLTFVASDYMDFKLIDKDLNEVQIDEGAVGELVISTKWEGGLIKRKNYRMGDIVKIVSYFPDLKFKVIGRADEMIVVKGLNLYPSTIQEVLGQASMEHDCSISGQLLVSKNDPIEDICLKISYITNGETVSQEFEKKLIKYIESELTTKTGITIPTRVVEMSELISNNGKVKIISRCL